MSNKRLYQLSDSEVTRPEEAKGTGSCRAGTARQGQPRQQHEEGRAGHRLRHETLLSLVPQNGNAALRKEACTGGAPHRGHPYQSCR